MTKRIIALYYANSITVIVRFWLLNDLENNYTADDLFNAYEFVLDNSLFTLFENNKNKSHYTL